MIEQHTLRLLVSLDSLLDTRAGTLSLLDLKKAAELLLTPIYASRIIDQFPGFDQKAFEDLYKKRDKKTLQYSMVTNVLKTIYDFIHRSFNRNLNSPFKVEAEVHINTFPYLLEDKEKDVIANAILAKSPLPFKLDFVRYSNEDLSPGFLKQNYNTLIAYDFQEWIDIHSTNKKIEETPIPEVTFFAPAILKFIDEKVPRDLSQKFIDTMMVFQLHLNLIFLPVDNFCAVIANKPKTDVPKDTSQRNVKDEEPKEEEIPLSGDDIHPSW